MNKRPVTTRLSLTVKRKYSQVKDKNQKQHEQSQIHKNLWPEENDDTFFINANASCSTDSKTKNKPNSETLQCFEDDSIFDKINLPLVSSENQDVHALPALQYSDLVNEMNSNVLFDNNAPSSNRTIKSKLSENFLNVKEVLNNFPLLENLSYETNSLDTHDNLFCDVVENNSTHFQSTQRFLKDVAPILALTLGTQLPIDTGNGTLLSETQLGNLYNYSQNNECLPCNKTSKEFTKDLSKINWDDTQTFAEISNEIGNFFGLPDRVQHLIFQHKGIKCLYEWQTECLELPAIKQHNNLIYALPTSGGKTLVSEILMLRELLCHKKNCIFILPYVSIVQEKVSALSPFAIALGFLVEEYTSGRGACPPVARQCRKSIYVASIEKASILIDSLIEANRLNEVGLVVVDELHLIGERGRGGILEALLSKIIFINAKIQIVGMSATIGNIPEISKFLKADVYTRGFRPIDLKEYIKCGCDILELNISGQTLEDMFIYSRSVNFKYSESIARADPDHLAGLVSESAPDQCCLIFCPTRKNCENVALLLSRILPKNKFLEYRKTEKQDLMDALKTVCGILSPVLAKTIPFGIAYHHSGLTSDERKFIETAYRFGVLSVICCTSTLAAGVNLPAKRVIIRAPYIGSEFLTLSRYKQMVGRAGRAGMGITGESILIISSKDNLRVGEMLFSPMDKALSSLDYLGAIGLQNLMLSAIGLKIASCRRDLYRLVQTTLLSVQSSIIGTNLEELILSILREMFKSKILQPCKEQFNNIDLKTTQTSTNINSQTKHQRDKIIYISKSSSFELTNIGRAAFKAGIDYKRAEVLYNELRTAQRHLVLSNYLHLLFLVVCFYTQNIGDEFISADAALLFRLYNSADEDTLQLFRLLGFTEAYAVKIAKTLSIQGPLELRLNRLFKALILVDVLDLVPLPNVAKKFCIDRGNLQSLVAQTISAASSMSRFCEHINELWCFEALFRRISKKMDRCCAAELEPLLDLPAVKINRAKQLFAAGFKSIEDIAKSKPLQLVRSMEHLSIKVATEIIAAAKIIVMKRLNDLEEETTALKNFINPSSDSF